MATPQQKSNTTPDFIPATQDEQDFIPAAPTGPVDESKRLGVDNPNLDNQKAPEPGVLNTLGREAKALGKGIVSIPGAMYHAASDPETPEESAKYGKGFEHDIGPTGRLIDRMAVQPTMHAIDWYAKAAKGQIPNATEQALSVAPEAIGQGASAPLAAKMIQEAPGAIAKVPPVRAARAGFAGAGEAVLNSPVVGPMMRGFGRGFMRSWNGSEAPPPPTAPPPPIRGSIYGSEPMKVAPPPVRGSIYGDMAAEPKAPIPPVRWGEIPAEETAPKAAPIPPMRWPGGRAPKMGATRPGGGDVTFVPEPRPTFTGEDPNYMASVPRNELGKMAVARKPGAAGQMQQLGKPIIYIPDEADFPGPAKR